MAQIYLDFYCLKLELYYKHQLYTCVEITKDVVINQYLFIQIK